MPFASIGKQREGLARQHSGWRRVRHEWRFVTRMPVWARFTTMALAAAGLLMGGFEAAKSYFPARELASSVKASGSLSSTQFRDAVYEALAQAAAYAEARNAAPAVLSTDQASQMIRAAKKEGLRVPRDYFNEMAGSLDAVQASHPGPALAESLFQARVVLAEYRSALETPPDLPRPPSAFLIPRSLAAKTRVTPETFSSPALDASPMAEGAEFFLPPRLRLFVDNIWVRDLTLVGASQTLDGIHWQNVTFFHARIRYQGGEVELKNVRFVNCTFGFLQNDRGLRLADAIALGPASLVLE